MKKIVLYITIMFCFGYSVFAQSNDLTRSQISLRDNIKSYLRTEGFQPEIDSDGDIKFKRQGKTYFIRISATDENPMYVSLSRYYEYSDNISRSKLIFFNANNSYKSCKVTPHKELFSIGVEMFVNSSTAFTSVFYKLVEVIEGVEDEVSKL